MSEFIVHQHNHAGWKTDVIKAESFEDAARESVLKYHGFLIDYAGLYSFELRTGDDGRIARYVVQWQSEDPKVNHFGPPLYSGDHWFSDQIREGEADDCPKCGGTGANHYNPFNECWSCGDKTKPGRASGKALGDQP